MIPKPMKDLAQKTIHSSTYMNTLLSVMNFLSTVLGCLLAVVQGGLRKELQNKDQILRLIQSGIKVFNEEQFLWTLFVDTEKDFEKD